MIGLPICSDGLKSGAARPFDHDVTAIASLAPVALDPSLPVSEEVASPARGRVPRAWVFGVALVLFAGGAGVGAPPTRAAGEAPARVTPTGAIEHWVKPPVVTFDPSLADLGPGAADAVRAAFGTWLGAGAPAITFADAKERGPLAADGVSRIMAGPITLHGHEHDLAITVSYADEASGKLLEADTIFNTAYTYGAVDDDGDARCKTYDLQSVATHEAGHFFGLSEDMTDTTTTMYIYTRACDVHKRALSTPDQDAITILYPPSDPSLVTARACSVAGTPGAPGSAAAALGLLAVAGVLARRKRAVCPV